MAKYKIEYMERDGKWRETSYSIKDGDIKDQHFLVEFFRLDECVNYRITKVE